MLQIFPFDDNKKNIYFTMSDLITDADDDFILERYVEHTFESSFPLSITRTNIDEFDNDVSLFEFYFYSIFYVLSNSNLFLYFR